jgi:hypothetical protein
LAQRSRRKRKPTERRRCSYEATRKIHP